MQQQRRRGCRALREQRVVGAANTRGSGCSIDWGGSESGSVLSQRLRGARVLCLLRRLHPPVTLRQSESVRQKLLHKSVPQLPISPSTHCTPVSGVNFGWSAGDEPPPPPLSPSAPQSPVTLFLPPVVGVNFGCRSRRSNEGPCQVRSCSCDARRRRLFRPARRRRCRQRRCVFTCLCVCVCAYVLVSAAPDLWCTFAIELVPPGGFWGPVLVFFSPVSWGKGFIREDV
jgi:hypothetical protein